MESVETLIIGAGPTGLGAGTRLHQNGKTSWLIVDKEKSPGGLSSTRVTKEGFLTDRGGHVVFSFFKYFDDLLQKAVGPYDDEENWATHVRKSHVITEEDSVLYKVPYPYQHNIGGLSEKTKHKCIEGIVNRDNSKEPTNFKEWILYNFGSGIADSFLFPYNFKIWAHDLSTMSKGWVANRVAKVDPYSVVKNAMNYTPFEKWGPNNIFRFPQRGGTGHIYEKVAELLPKENQRYSSCVTAIEPSSKIATLQDGSTIKYENLVSTMPLDILMEMVGMTPDRTILRHSSTHIVAFGFEGANPNRETCWSYFPDEDVPFYRATVFSNYGKYNVPDQSKHYSLMLEIAESEFKSVDSETLVEECLAACRRMGMTNKDSKIVSTFYERFEYGYPTPTIGLEEYCSGVHKDLKKMDIYSRGRFGAYLYQVANQDHSVMQGVQVIDNIAMGTPETVLNCSDHINSMYNTDYTYP